MNIIDPHIHLFDLIQGDYQWLKKENPPYWPDKAIIHHSFTEQDLLVDSTHSLAAFVHIEAGFDNLQPWREIAWLESQCKKPFKSVACVNLNLAPTLFAEQVKRLVEYKSVVGCRHILDEQAIELLSDINVQTNLAYLAHAQLSFDVQMSLGDLAAVELLTTIMTNLPKLTVIIDHAGWPPYLLEQAHEENIHDILVAKDQNNTMKPAQLWENWQAGIKKLSPYACCVIKCSGWEMVDRDYPLAWQKKVIQSCLQYFGEQRVMLASNFPLCLFSKSYQEFWQTDLALTEKQQRALTYANALYWYQFSAL